MVEYNKNNVSVGDLFRNVLTGTLLKVLFCGDKVVLVQVVNTPNPNDFTYVGAEYSINYTSLPGFDKQDPEPEYWVNVYKQQDKDFGPFRFGQIISDSKEQALCYVPGTNPEYITCR